jgi:anti-sigma regulatory factor (Ser/Thr protein kinase)
MDCSQRSVTYIEVSDSSAIGYCRRLSAEIFRRGGANSGQVSAAKLVVTELVSNIDRHAGEGAVHIVSDPKGPTLDVIAVDKGPGFNLSNAVVDGYSTKGGPGLGLGAIARTADRLSVHSAPGDGTVVHASIGPRLTANPPVVALGVNAWREAVSGDHFFVQRINNSLKVLVFDALGHGASAHRQALELLAAAKTSNPAGDGFTLRDIQDRLGATRGAVAASMTFHDDTGEIDFEGVGNIGAVCLTPSGAVRVPFRGGMLGRSGQPSTASFRADTSTRVVMHTDGVEPRWLRHKTLGTAWSGNELTSYTLAAMLLRDFRNTRDDSLVVIVDLKPSACE